MSRFDDLAALHRPGRPFVLPNAWDVASALLLARAGHPAVGTTSLGVTAAAGLPDGAGQGRELTLGLARALAGRLDVPLTVDLEGGFSDDPDDVAALVSELAAAGVTGVNLEDGRPDGTLRPTSLHAAVVATVVAAVPHVFVNARTDTYWLGVGDPGGRLEETLSRASAYARAGAHGVFVPALTDLDDTATVARSAGVPLNVLWRPGVALAELAAAGVARVSTGSALYRSALGASLGLAAQARGDTSPDRGPVTYADVQTVLGPQGQLPGLA